MPTTHRSRRYAGGWSTPQAASLALVAVGAAVAAYAWTASGVEPTAVDVVAAPAVGTPAAVQEEELLARETSAPSTASPTLRASPLRSPATTPAVSPPTSRPASPPTSPPTLPPTSAPAVKPAPRPATTAPSQAPAPPPPPPGYDLVVTSVGMTGSGTAGSEVRFTATITNRGADRTPAGTIHGVRFDLDGTFSSWSDTYLGPLAPGASVTLIANGAPAGSSPVWTAVAGKHRVRAWVDDVDRMPGEHDEDNNQLSRTLHIR